MGRNVARTNETSVLGFLNASSFELKGLQWLDTQKQGTANVKVKLTEFKFE